MPSVGRVVLGHLELGGVQQSIVKYSEIKSKDNDIYSLIFIKNWLIPNAGSSGDPAYPYANYFNKTKPANPCGFSQLDYISENPAVAITSPVRWQYDWGAAPAAEVTPEEGIKGQNTDNPKSTFYNHFVVRIYDTIYDPSYGTIFEGVAQGGQSAWDNAKAKWEDKSLAAIALPQEYTTAQGQQQQRLMISKASTAVTEVTFS